MKHYIIRRISNDKVYGYITAEGGAAALRRAVAIGIITNSDFYYAEEE